MSGAATTPSLRSAVDSDSDDSRGISDCPESRSSAPSRGGLHRLEELSVPEDDSDVFDCQFLECCVCGVRTLDYWLAIRGRFIC